MFGVWTDIEAVPKLGSSYDTTCIFREERILMKRVQDWPTKQIKRIVQKYHANNTTNSNIYYNTLLGMVRIHKA